MGVKYKEKQDSQLPGPPRGLGRRCEAAAAEAVCVCVYTPIFYLAPLIQPASWPRCQALVGRASTEFRSSLLLPPGVGQSPQTRLRFGGGAAGMWVAGNPFRIRERKKIEGDMDGSTLTL